MITKITGENRNEYNILFDEATKIIKAKYPEKLGEEDAINTIEQYFSFIGDLQTLDTKYIMLPLDEEPFEIDANSRSIRIPNAFRNNGVSVQGDVIAETLFLRIDRYFDYMDLMETTPYIQWKRADGKEGASKIQYIDFKSEPNKLILSWPLTGVVTEVPGTLQFSVRFLKRDSDNVVYSFNTLSANITIKPALKPAVDYTEYDDASALYLTAIENSQHSSSGEAPAEPTFALEDVNTDLPAKAYLTPSNTLVLKAQAYTTDTGAISYGWTYKRNEGYMAKKQSTPSFEKTADVARKSFKNYYTNAGDSYKLYGGDFSAEDIEAGIYERFDKYEIPASEAEIIGEYWVSATNRLGFNSTAKNSVHCKVPGPEVLEFTQNLNDKAFIADGALNLNVAVKTDEVPEEATLDVAYAWGKNTADADPDKMQPIPEASGANLVVAEAAEPGWYKVDVTSTLNRAKKTIKSIICKVTNKPVAPTLKHKEKDPDISYSAGQFSDGVVKIKAVYNEENPYQGELYSEGVTFQWFENEKPITAETHPYVSGVDQQTITIDWNKSDKTPDSYHCVVTNHLNGETAASRTGYFLVRS